MHLPVLSISQIAKTKIILEVKIKLKINLRKDENEDHSNKGVFM